MYCVYFSVRNRFDETRGLRKNKGWDVASLFRIQKSPPQWSACLASPLLHHALLKVSSLVSSKHQATGSREGRYEYNLSPDQTPGRARTGWGREGRGAVQHSGLGESWEWDWGQPGVTERKWQPGQPLKWRVKLSFRINTTGGKLVFWRSEKSRLAFDNCNPC